MSEMSSLSKRLREVTGLHAFAELFGFSWTDGSDWEWHDVACAMADAIDAMVGERSCALCPEMDNPDSYISHLQSALKWHDEHVPRPTNPRSTCVVLEGEKPPEEVMFIRDEGGVTHYLPEGTCYYIPDETGFTWWDENDVEHYEEYSASYECCSASCDKCGHSMMVGDEGWFDGWDEITEWTEEDGSEHKGYILKPRFKFCPNCGARVVSE